MKLNACEMQTLIGLFSGICGAISIGLFSREINKIIKKYSDK